MAESSSNVAVISAVGAALCAAITVGLPLLTKRRAEAARMTIASVRGDADRLEGSYQRLERENARLTGEVNGMRDRIEDLERTVHSERRRCEQLESHLRRLGHFPSAEEPNEDGGAR